MTHMLMHTHTHAYHHCHAHGRYPCETHVSTGHGPYEWQRVNMRREHAQGHVCSPPACTTHRVSRVLIVCTCCPTCTCTRKRTRSHMCARYSCSTWSARPWPVHLPRRLAAPTPLRADGMLADSTAPRCCARRHRCTQMLCSETLRSLGLLRRPITAAALQLGSRSARTAGVRSVAPSTRRSHQPAPTAPPWIHKRVPVEPG